MPDDLELVSIQDIESVRTGLSCFKDDMLFAIVNGKQYKITAMTLLKAYQHGDTMLKCVKKRSRTYLQRIHE